MLPLGEVACAVVLAWTSLTGGTIPMPSPSAVPVAEAVTEGGMVPLTVPLLVPPEASVAVPRLADAPRTVLMRPMAEDTIRKPRAKAVVYSDAYTWRLEWHRRLSWAMLPLFAASYVAGDQLMKASEHGTTAPTWARPVHQIAANGSAVLFGLNGITGALNLWEGRNDPTGRTRRWVHSLLFTAASGGFVYAGTQLADGAEQSRQMRQQHRTVALTSIGVSTASWLLMLIGN